MILDALLEEYVTKNYKTVHLWVALSKWKPKYTESTPAFVESRGTH